MVRITAFAGHIQLLKR